MSRDLGRFGESWAVGFLTRQGYQIVDRNVRYRVGEIDIVARDNECLVFVEVKCRRGARYGAPEASLTPRRFSHLEAAIDHYLQDHGLEEEYRLDVVAIEVDTGGRVSSCKLLRAVGAPGA
ncbi:MAG TPA: YraN family protein [Chloroflexota bacterium]